MSSTLKPGSYGSSRCQYLEQTFFKVRLPRVILETWEMKLHGAFDFSPGRSRRVLVVPHVVVQDETIMSYTQSQSFSPN